LFDLIEPSQLNAEYRQRFAIEMGFRRGVFENRSGTDLVAQVTEMNISIDCER
jgi:hypothetical protein